MLNAKKTILITALSVLSLSIHAQDAGTGFAVQMPDMGDEQSNALTDYYADTLTDIGAERANEYLQEENAALRQRGENEISDLAEHYLGIDNGDGSSNSTAQVNGAVYIPPVRSPQSLCASETARRAKEFYDELRNRTCNAIDLTPDVSDSRFLFQSEDVGCNFSLPGLPQMQNEGEEPSRCRGVQAITGDIIDNGVGMINQGWNQQLEGINGSVEAETGIDSGQWTNGYEDAPTNGRDAINDWRNNGRTSGSGNN